MDLLPAHPALLAPARIALTGAIAGDPVANPLETSEFLDVEVNEPTRFPLFIAHNRLGGGEVLCARQSGPPQHTTGRSGRNPGFQRDMPAAQALAAQRDDALRQRL